jgi:hypothetical protein
MGLKGIVFVLSKNIVDRFIEDLLRGIYAYGYESPSAVQSRAIQQICKGRGISNLKAVLIGRCHRTGYLNFMGNTNDSTIWNWKDSNFFHFDLANYQHNSTRNSGSHPISDKRTCNTNPIRHPRSRGIPQRTFPRHQKHLTYI